MAKIRPPRVYFDSKGKYVIIKGKKHRISTDLSDKDLIKYLIQLVTRQKRRRNRRRVSKNGQILTSVPIKTTSTSGTSDKQLEKYQLLEYKDKVNKLTIEYKNAKDKLKDQKSKENAFKKKLDKNKKEIEDILDSARTDGILPKKGYVAITSEDGKTVQIDKNDAQYYKDLANKNSDLNKKIKQTKEEQDKAEKNIILAKNEIRKLQDTISKYQNSINISQKEASDAKKEIIETKIESKDKLKKQYNSTLKTQLNGVFEKKSMQDLKNSFPKLITKDTSKYKKQEMIDILQDYYKDASNKQLKLGLLALESQIPNNMAKQNKNEIPLNKKKGEIILKDRSSIYRPKTEEDVIEFFMKKIVGNKKEGKRENYTDTYTLELYDKALNKVKKLNQEKPKTTTNIDLEQELENANTIPDATTTTTTTTNANTIPDATTTTTTTTNALIPGPDQQKKTGSGNGEKGMYDYEIDKIMSRYADKGFLGTIAADQVKNLASKIKKDQKVSFIMNLDKKSQSGSHWVAVYIDPVDSQTVEYYDSFGREPSKEFVRDIKYVIDKLKPPGYLKFKINRIISQKASTSNCGPFSMKFIIDRFRGKPFPECTGYDNSEKEEKEIEKFKKTLPEFGYI